MGCQGVRAKASALRVPPAGSRGDCEQNEDGQVSWDVAINGHGPAHITLGWPVGVTPDQPLGPPPGPLACTIEMPDELGPQFRAMALRLASEGRYEEPTHVAEGQSEGWTWRSS